MNCITKVFHIFTVDFFFNSEALKYFRNQLTVYEQEEILNYAELWFLGLEAKKIEGLPETQNNNCYDDEHGTYIKVRGKIMVLVFWATIFVVTICPLLVGLYEINEGLR